MEAFSRGLRGEAASPYSAAKTGPARLIVRTCAVLAALAGLWFVVAPLTVQGQFREVDRQAEQVPTAPRTQSLDVGGDAADIDSAKVISVDSRNTKGKVTLVNGKLTYDPNGQFQQLGAGETATDTFLYTVQKPDGSTDTISVSVMVNGINDPPSAKDDAGTGFTTNEDSPFTTASVLDNDSDPDRFDNVRVESLDHAGTIGLVVNNGDGTFRYDPNGKFEQLRIGETAHDQFQYTIRDDSGANVKAKVNVSITGINDAPANLRNLEVLDYTGSVTGHGYNGQDEIQPQPDDQSSPMDPSWEDWPPPRHQYGQSHGGPMYDSQLNPCCGCLFCEMNSEMNRYSDRRYLRGEALWLHRNRSHPRTLTVDRRTDEFNVTTGRIVLDTDDVEFDYEAGFRIAAGLDFIGGPTLEASYFWIPEWSSRSRTPENPLQSYVPYWGHDPETIDTDSFDFAYQHSVEYESTLHNAELNLQQEFLPCVSGLAGVRYMNVEEEFAFSTIAEVSPLTGPGEVGLYRIETSNHVVGFQLGGDLQRPVVEDRLRVQARGKAALMMNFLDQDSLLYDRVVSDPSPRTNLETGNSDVSLATLIELGLFAVLDLGDHVAIRGGYELMALRGLALAPDQLDLPQWINGRRHLSDNGRLVYHGPSAGIEVTW